MVAASEKATATFLLSTVIDYSTIGQQASMNA